MILGNNPVLTGFHPDPCILRVGGDYYIATSTFQWFPGVELYHSTNLINWEVLPSPLNRVSQLDMRGNPNSGGVWAPCLSYCNGTYYLIYTNVKNFHGIFKDTHNYLVTATDINGPWSEPIYLNSSGFDPSLFHDDDGRKYLVNMRWDHRMEKNDFSGILLQEYSEKEKRLVGPVYEIFKGTQIGATEAPHIYKKNGYYYLMVAEGGTMYNHGVLLARSKNLLGPYEADAPLLTARDDKESYLQRTGHGSLVETPEGDLYVAYLCGRPTGNKKRCILGRETCIAKVKWVDGWLRLAESETTTPPLTYSVNLPQNDKKCDTGVDFFKGTLPHKYKTLRIPLEEFGSLTENEGYLRLYGYEAPTSWNKQALVARRLQHFNAEATIKMSFEPKTFQQMAGLNVIYDTYNFFYLYMSIDECGDNVLRIIARDNFNFYNPVGYVSIGKNTTAWLRVRIKENLTLQFYYSVDGVDFLEIGPTLDCSNLTDEAYCDINHEGHTGTFVGMACTDLTGGTGNTGGRAYADFELMEYKVLNK